MLRHRFRAAAFVGAAALGLALAAPVTAQASAHTTAHTTAHPAAHGHGHKQPHASTAQHVGVPAYFNPNASPGSTYWTQLDQSGAAGGIAIANPDSGPGTAFDQGYADAIQAASAAGIKVIGYVDTGYFGTTGRTTRGGQTTTSAWTTQVEADVADWYSWYGGYGLSGIFFDDAQNVCGTNNAYVDLYIAVNTYTKQNHPGALTADNPGAIADQCYAQAADVLVMFEGTYAGYSTWTAPSWEISANTPDKFWNLVYDTPTQADMESAIARSKQNDVGYVYVTPDNLPNPWDTLPDSAYWNDEISQAGTGGSSGGGGSSCTTSAGSGDLTSLTACKYSTYEYFQATFNASTSLHHVFINTDDNTATGFQLPSPSTSKLGADYLLENNTLYRSTCACWGWSAVSGVNPQMTVSGDTYTWTVPLSALSGAAATEQAEFNENTSYTAPLDFGQS